MMLLWRAVDYVLPWALKKQWYRRVYLKSRHWLSFRARILAKRGLKCQRCKAVKVFASDLNLHHLDYSRLGHEDPSDVVVLCWSCHAKAHSK